MQKLIDTLLSIDVVDLAATQQISTAILLTGDADYIPCVKMAKNHGTSVILYHSQDRDSYHWELWRECDERFPIGQDFIEKIKV